MSEKRAWDLSEGSVVAGGRSVLLKKSNAASQPPGTPFYEEWWVVADTYAVPLSNAVVDSLFTVVLREGWGSEDA